MCIRDSVWSMEFPKDVVSLSKVQFHYGGGKRGGDSGPNQSVLAGCPLLPVVGGSTNGSAPAPLGVSVASEFDCLGRLHAAGVLDSDEFTAAKRRLLQQ